MGQAQYVSAAVISMTANTDRYRSLTNGNSATTFTTTESTANTSCERALTFSKLFVRITTNSKTLSNGTVKFRNNGADGNLTVTIPFGTTGTYSDTVNTDTVAATNNFCTVFRYGASGTGTITCSAMSVVADYTGAESITLYQNSTGTVVGAATKYSVIYGSLVFQTTENTTYLVSPVAGTYKNSVVRISANTRNGSCTYTLRKNAADTACVVTIPTSTTGTFKDTTNFVSVVPGDQICYKTVLSGSSGNVTPISTHIEFDTTSDTFVTGTEMITSYTTISSFYQYIGGVSTGTLTDANSKLDFNLDSYSANNMRLYISSNTVGAGLPADSFVYLRKNGVDTSLYIVVAFGLTGWFSNISEYVTISNGDDLNFKVRVPATGTFYTKRIILAFTKNLPVNPRAERNMFISF